MEDLVQIKISNWQDKGLVIRDEMKKYNWEYRKKICTKCPREIQRKLNCRKVNNFKDEIQETWCEKILNARTQKFRKEIEKFWTMHPYENKIKL